MTLSVLRVNPVRSDLGSATGAAAPANDGTSTGGDRIVASTSPGYQDLGSAAAAAHIAAEGPDYSLLDNHDQHALAQTHAAATASGKEWPDDPTTGALLLRGKASDAYVQRYLSSANFASAKKRAAKMDAQDSSRSAVFRSTVGDLSSRPAQATISAIAGHGLRFGHLSQSEIDGDMAAARQNVGTALAISGNPSDAALGALYLNYDRLPHAAQGTLDAALRTVADPTLLAGGVDGAVLESALGDALPSLLRAGEDLGSNLESGLGAIGWTSQPSLAPAGGGEGFLDASQLLAKRAERGEAKAASGAATRRASEWGTISNVKPEDVGFVQVGVERGQMIYLRPGDVASFKGATKSLESVPHLAVQRDAGRQIGSMTASEAQVAWTLVGEGKTVTRLAASRVKGQETHDFLVSGQRTELWTPARMEVHQVPKSLPKGIKEKSGQGGADYIIVDLSQQPAIDKDTAVEGAIDALRATKSAQLKHVRIMGNGFDFTADRIGIRENGAR